MGSYETRSSSLLVRTRLERRPRDGCGSLGTTTLCCLGVWFVGPGFDEFDGEKHRVAFVWFAFELETELGEGGDEG